VSIFNMNKIENATDLPEFDWQSQSARRLTAEDKREIVANLTGFFDTLAGWSKRDRHNIPVTVPTQRSTILPVVDEVAP
jgi:hypothetical protein